MDLKTQRRIQLIKEAIAEADQFIDRAHLLMDRLNEDTWARYQCKESAALKRKSMDLTRALTEYRKA